MAGLKTQDNTQFALVATNGARPVPLTPGEGIEPLADSEGRLIVNVASIGPAPGAVIYYDNGGAFAAQSVANVAAVSRTLIRVYGFKTAAGVEYLQLYNTAGGVPVGTPFAQFPVPQDGAFSLDYGNGRLLSAGLVVALSTTATVYTAAAASMWLNAELI